MEYSFVVANFLIACVLWRWQQQMHTVDMFLLSFRLRKAFTNHLFICSNKIIVWRRWNKWMKEENCAKRNTFQCISQNVTIFNRFFFPFLFRFLYRIATLLHSFFFSSFAIHNRTACCNLNNNSIYVFLWLLDAVRAVTMCAMCMCASQDWIWIGDNVNGES